MPIDDSLLVWLDRYGSFELVGRLCRDVSYPSEATFSYYKSWVDAHPSLPIFRALPVTDSPADPQITRACFGGLMPDGPLRMRVAVRKHIPEDDFCSFLEVLNNETVGALCFGTPGFTPGADPSYSPFGLEALRSFAQEPVAMGAEAACHAHLSLAGAVSKIGLYKASGGEWLLPEGGAASTHIIKADHSYPGLVFNEAICLAAARNLGLSTADYELVDVGLQEPLLAVKRFDREVPDSPILAGGIPLPRRVHQEDLCQAMGRGEHLRYERHSGDYLPDIRNIIEGISDDVFRDIDEFARQLSFDYLIGNCDNHAKNYSLLYSESLRSARLSPHYDVLSTSCYADLSTEMGIPLCRQRAAEKVSHESVVEAMGKLYDGPRGVDLFYSIREALPGALGLAIEEIASQGYAQAEEIGRQLQAGLVERMRVFDLNSRVRAFPPPAKRGRGRSASRDLAEARASAIGQSASVKDGERARSQGRGKGR